MMYRRAALGIERIAQSLEGGIVRLAALLDDLPAAASAAARKK
jgi:hypothetical protein